MHTPPLAPRDLLARAQAGDGDAFCALCAPLQDRLLRQAFALCRDEAMAQDLTQETLIAGWRSIRRYQGTCQLSTWLCSILLYRHKSAVRRRSWRNLIAPFLPGEQTTPEVEERIPSPDQAAELSERAGRILETLDRLPRRQREVIFLRFYADESLEGIAAALDCSLGTVKSRLFHALANLRKMRYFQEDRR